MSRAGRLYDKDGIDGPFEANVRAAIRDDAKGAAEQPTPPPPESAERLVRQLLVHLAPLAVIGELIRTQDNRITSQPLFLVQEKREIYRNTESGPEPMVLWEFSDACFTEAAADALIRRHAHNLHSPRVYVASGFRNTEWQMEREFMRDLATPGHPLHDAIAAYEAATGGAK